VPFEQILQIVSALDGVEAVLFLDSTGEMIFSLGGEDSEKFQLLAAYQGILLNGIARTGTGLEQTIITLCQKRSILTRHIKDGYFICVIFSSEAYFARTHVRIKDACELLAREL